MRPILAATGQCARPRAPAALASAKADSVSSGKPPIQTMTRGEMMPRIRLRARFAVTLTFLTMPTILVMLCLPMAAVAATAASGEKAGEELREAALAGDLAKVRSLLDAGVPANAPAPRWGQTPLMFAAQKGHEDVVRLLLDRGADVNARETFFGETPLGSALREDHRKLALLLLSKGARQADDALEAAIEKDDLELARAALATGFIAPLDLKAARKIVEASDKTAMKELLATATAKPVPHKVVEVSPDRLKALAGRYGTRTQEVVVSVRDKGLAMSGLGDKEIVFD